MGKTLSFLSKKVLIYGTLGVLVIAVGVFIFKDGKNKQMVYVTRGDIFQEVAATGKVKPNQSVNLGFDKSGRVANVYNYIGERVKRGGIIAMLESGEIVADLAKAKASLLEENIKLRELKSTAPISYNDASKNLDAAIKKGFSEADNAVRNKADQFFKNIPDNPQFGVSITPGNFSHYFNVSTDFAIDINSRRKNIETVLNNWQKRILDNNSADLISEADQTIVDLNTISIFLDKMASAVNTFTSADYAYDTTVSNYKTTISSARSDVSSAISDIVTAKDKFNTAPTLGQGGEFENVLTQEAKVSQAESAVSSLEASLNKSIIRAPFDGTITLQDAKVGNTISASIPLVSVISQNEMYIEANISEIHIGKIAVHNPVTITLDAFPGEEFLGEVSYIEPGDVVIDGIVNYKIRVALNNLDPKIKSGLTANLKIQTAKRAGALSIPLYVIFRENNQTFVNKVVDKKAQKTSVNLGIVGNDGLVEVLNGLNQGDIVEF